MAEWRLFPEGTIPEFTTARWYRTRGAVPHLEQADHRGRLLLTAKFVRHACQSLADMGMPVTGIVDLGCGDGGLLSLLPDNPPAWGYDLSPAAVTVARDRRHVDARLEDVDGRNVIWADLAVATEILEHLADPHAFVRKIAGHGAKVLIASSPVNETPESHYEFHTWAWDQDGYANLLTGGGFSIVRHEIAGGAQVIMGVR